MLTLSPLLSLTVPTKVPRHRRSRRPKDWQRRLLSLCSKQVGGDLWGAGSGPGSVLLAYPLPSLILSPSPSHLTATVLIIHAGGYSKRLPQVSAVGKIFTTLPLSKFTGITTFKPRNLTLPPPPPGASPSQCWSPHGDARAQIHHVH